MNPSQFGPDEIKEFDGYIFPAFDAPRVTTLRNVISGIDNYDTFVNSRQSYKTSVRYENANIFKVAEKIFEGAAPSNAFFKVTKKRAPPIMGFGTSRESTIPDYVAEASPSRILPMFYAVFHNADNADYLEASYTINAVMLTLSSLPIGSASLAAIWKTLASMRGMQAIFSAIPVAEAQGIADIAALTKATTNPRQSVFMYLMARTLTHTAVITGEIWDEVKQCGETKILPSKIKNKTGIFLPEFVRGMRLFEKIASDVFNQKPYIYAGVTRAAYASGVSSSTILGMPLKKIVQEAQHALDWERKVNRKKVGSSVIKVQKVKYLFSGLRSEWSNHYASRVAIYRTCIEMLMVCKPKIKWLGFDLPKKAKNEEIALECLLSEMMYLSATSLAYKYAKVTLDAELITDSKSATFDTVIKEYMSLIENTPEGMIGDLVKVEAKEVQIDNNSAISKDIDKIIADVHNLVPLLSTNKRAVSEVIKSLYIRAIDSVRVTIQEAMMRDKKSMEGSPRVKTKFEPKWVRKVPSEVKSPPPEFQKRGSLIPAAYLAMKRSANPTKTESELEWEGFTTNMKVMAEDLKELDVDISGRLNQIGTTESMPATMDFHRDCSKLMKFSRIMMDSSAADTLDIIKKEHARKIVEISRKCGYNASVGKNIMG